MASRKPSWWVWCAAAAAAWHATPVDGGIAGLQTWFRKKFPSAFEHISEAATREYEHVLLDMNQVLHHSVRKANDLEHAKILVFMELNLQLRRCVPTKSVVLAFDGPGPRAKLLTQRRRRAKRRTPAGKLSSMVITPGSDFMREMLDACAYYACRRLQTDPAYRSVRFWISGSQVAGEGEVKIIDWLNCHLPPAQPDGPDTRSICVIGSDVDLVLQCISALPRLMGSALEVHGALGSAEGGGGGSGGGGGGGGSERGDGGGSDGGGGAFRFEVFTHSTVAKTHAGAPRRGQLPWVRISVLELAAQLEASFPNCSAVQTTHDLTALLCMYGNDYLPRLRGVTISELYGAYVRHKGTPEFGGARGLVDARRRSFDVEFLRALMATLDERAQEITHVSAADLAQMRRATDEATVRGAVYAMKLNECAQVLRLTNRPRYIDERAGRGGAQWRSTVVLGGQRFRSGPHPLAKSAQWAAAKRALGALCPERFEAAQRAVDAARRRLHRYEERGTAAGAAAAAAEGDDDDDEEQPAAAATGDLFDAREYLRGVLWTLQMYIDGKCPDYSYAYGARLAPSPGQLCAWLDGEPAEDAALALVPPVSYSPPPHPAAVLATLVPAESLQAVVAPSVAQLLSAQTREMMAALDTETEGERSLERELLAEETGRADILQSLAELMAAAENDALPHGEHGEHPPGAGRLDHWHVYSRAAARRAMARSALPHPPTSRSTPLKPFGLAMRRTRTTTKPPCRPWH